MEDETRQVIDLRKVEPHDYWFRLTWREAVRAFRRGLALPAARMRPGYLVTAGDGARGGGGGEFAEVTGSHFAGEWRVPPRVTQVEFQVIGGGGAGRPAQASGGAYGTGSTTVAGGGGGGSGGGISPELIDALRQRRLHEVRMTDARADTLELWAQSEPVTDGFRPVVLRLVRQWREVKDSLGCEEFADGLGTAITMLCGRLMDLQMEDKEP